MTLDRAALVLVVRIALEDCGAERERGDCLKAVAVMEMRTIAPI
jgi:hypothetical protein